MATNLLLDDNLLQEAQKVGGFETKTEAVIHALQDFITRKKQEEIIKLFGIVEYNKDYNYKELRQRK